MLNFQMEKDVLNAMLMQIVMVVENVWFVMNFICVLKGVVAKKMKPSVEKNAVPPETSVVETRSVVHLLKRVVTINVIQNVISKTPQDIGISPLANALVMSERDLASFLMPKAFANAPKDGQETQIRKPERNTAHLLVIRKIRKNHGLPVLPTMKSVLREMFVVTEIPVLR